MDAAITEFRQVTVDNRVGIVKNALMNALGDIGRLDPRVVAMDGMSGRKYRLFINNLIASLPSPSYLEVGSLTGSTLCAAICGNTVKAVAIDNWSEFGGPRDTFFANLERFRGPQNEVQVVESDFRAVDYAALGCFDVYLFDGPHAAQDQFDGIALALPALADPFVLIVDDWNWEQVRTGTFQALGKLRLSMLYGIEIRSTIDNTHPAHSGPQSDWHNGYFIAVLRHSDTTA